MNDQVIHEWNGWLVSMNNEYQRMVCTTNDSIKPLSRVFQIQVYSVQFSLESLTNTFALISLAGSPLLLFI